MAARQGHTPSARALAWLICCTTPAPLPAPLAAHLSGCRARFLKRQATTRRPQKNRHKAIEAAFHLSRPAGRQHQSNRPKLARALAVELEQFQRNGKRSRANPRPTSSETVSVTALVCARQIERDSKKFKPIAREIFAELLDIHHTILEQAHQLDAVVDELAALAGTPRTGHRLADALPNFNDFVTAKIAAIPRHEGNN